MGLDSVELVMELESRFRVKLPDAEMYKVKTVADLAAVVVRQLPRAEGYSCPTTRTFFLLRRSFQERLGVSRRLLRPSTRLDDILPSDRHAAWTQISTDLHTVPPLQIPRRFDEPFLWASGLALFAWLLGSGAIWGFYGAGPGVAIGMTSFIVICAAIRGTSHALRTALPDGIETLRDLALFVAPVELPSRGSGARLLVERRVLNEVRGLTAKFMGLPLETVQPQSELVRDLGMG